MFETRLFTAEISRYERGITPLECVNGTTLDVTEYIDFGVCDWVVFKNNAGPDHPELGICILGAYILWQLMTYWVLTNSFILI